MLVNQILDLQKLDEHLLSLDLFEFEIISFCQEIVASFEGYCYQSMCKLIFESNVCEAIVRIDQIRLQAIIYNLLSNASKFNNEGGFVKFNLEVNESLIKLEIRRSFKSFFLLINFDFAPKVGFSHINKLIASRIVAIIDMLMIKVIFI